MKPKLKKVEGKKQLVVTCDECKGVIALSREMTKEEAEKARPMLAINPFGAPRCKKCKIEPYSDINLMHTIHIEDFDKDRTLTP